MNQREKWTDYQKEREKLERENLPPKEYERRVKELAERLGL